MKSINYKLITGLFILCFSMNLSCTKLDPVPYSVVTSDVFWADPVQAANAVAPVYDALNGFANGENMRLANVSGGQIVDFRSWTYLEFIWTHTWPVNMGEINQMWNTFYKGVTSANFILAQLDGLADKPSNIAKINAQLKVARAFFLYNAMDNFGNIPLDTMFNADPATIKTNSRLEVFNFLERELLANTPLLDDKSDLNYGRVNKQVGYTLLAKLYLNAQVYTGTPRWANAITACDQVINSGLYSLTPNYFDNFSFDNNIHKDENILVAPKSTLPNGGFPGMMETLHEDGGKAVGITSNPWNGFCATADMYNKYERSDKRIRQWLVGTQREAANGTRTIDDNYTPGAIIRNARGILSYSLNVISLDPALYPNSDSADFAGARNVKYYPEQGVDGINMANDLVMMRLADVYLMKVEAELRLNGTVSSVNLFNQVRERAYGNASGNIAAPTLNDIYDERTREFMWEGYSRTDGIRFEVASGTPYFSAARKPEKTLDPADGHRRLFPIPAVQMTANSNLKQNPGY